jgi:hypothetical protein
LCVEQEPLTGRGPLTIDARILVLYRRPAVRPAHISADPRFGAQSTELRTERHEFSPAGRALSRPSASTLSVVETCYGAFGGRTDGRGGSGSLLRVVDVGALVVVVALEVVDPFPPEPPPELPPPPPD